MKPIIVFIKPAILMEGWSSHKEFPSSLAYLWSYVKSRLGRDIHVSCIDMAIEAAEHPALDMLDVDMLGGFLKNRLDAILPRNDGTGWIFAISCYTSYQYVPALCIIKAVKLLAEQGAITRPVITVGGYHPTMVPRDFNIPGVDFIIRGEGEEAFLEVIKNATGHQLSPRERDQGPRVIIGRPVQNLDDLPNLDFSPYEHYFSLPVAKSVRFSLTLSRGCPNSCNFCIEKPIRELQPRNHGWRAYSPSRAMEEIRAVIDIVDSTGGDPESTGAKESRCMEIALFDPIFGYKRRWRDKVIDGIIELDSPYFFWGETRVDTIGERDLIMFKKAKLKLILGVESGSKHTLLRMNKTPNPGRYLSMLENLMAMGEKFNYFPFSMNLISNFPGETLPSIDENFQFMQHLTDQGFFFTITHFQFYNLFPGDGVHANMEYWENKHGTKFYSKDWWRRVETMPFACLIDASRSLTFEDASIVYKDGYCDLLRALMDNAPDLSHKFAMIRALRAVGKRHDRQLELLNTVQGAVSIGT